MTTLYHWTIHREAIEQSGFIKRELETGFVPEDGFDLNCVWFTQNQKFAGASASLQMCLMDTVTRAFDMHGRQLSDSDIDKYVQLDDTPEVRTCFAFESADIGAQLWTRYKTKWMGISPKKRAYIRELDIKSTLNGDDVNDYWVTTTNVDIKKARIHTTFTASQIDLLHHYGYRSVSDCYNKIKPKLLRAMRMG
jgi:hypothetical protein